MKLLEMKRTCACCGRIVGDDERLVLTENGDEVCNGCIAAYYVRCHECGEFVHLDNMLSDSLENNYCESCFESHTHTCDGCGDIFHDDDGVQTSGECFCDSCMEDRIVCVECGEAAMYDDSFELPNGGRICHHCYENYFGTCEDCGDIVSTDYLTWNDHDECYYCENCADSHMENEPNSDGIYGYHEFDSDKYMKHWALGERSFPNVYFGVELECDNGNFDFSDFDGWSARNELVHFEYDGSLGRNGVEMITQPCTLRFHQGEMRWDELCARLKRQGFSSHYTETCGLHVHISRNSLSNLAISKLDAFVNHAHEFLSQVSRRSEIYVSHTENRQWNGKGKFDPKKYRRGRFHDDRYRPVNTTNSDTVEIRIFRGTLKYETILGTLEMLHALIRFLENVPISELLPESEPVDTELRFVEFCAVHRKEYPHVMPMLNSLVKRGPTVPSISWHYNNILQNNIRKENRKCA